MQAHHECIRCWEHDQSVYKCIHVHITCNKSWMEVATFDYKVHAGLEEIENSCHSPRHAARHFYDHNFCVARFRHDILFLQPH